MATTPMTAISSMSAPVKARPLEVLGAVDAVVVAPSLTGVVLDPEDIVTVGVLQAG
jgi:hypothetical protein